MNSPKLSIVMPCYNVDKYLAQAIESILDQTLTDFELIAVNDGSTDRSGEIIDAYAATDARIVPVHQVNGGYGSACNAGLQKAAGVYVAIFESDDIASKDMYRELCSAAEVSSADIVKSNGYYEYIDGHPTKITLFPENLTKITTNTDELFGKVWFRHPTIWNAIYKRDYIEEFNIRMPVTPGASFQDVNFLVSLYTTARKVHLIGKTHYYYRIHGNQSVASADKLVPHIVANWRACLAEIRGRNTLESHSSFLKLIVLRQMETLCLRRLSVEDNKFQLLKEFSALVADLPGGSTLGHEAASDRDKRLFKRLSAGKPIWRFQDVSAERLADLASRVPAKLKVGCADVKRRLAFFKGFNYRAKLQAFVKNRLIKMLGEFDSSIRVHAGELNALRSYLLDSHFLGVVPNLSYSELTQKIDRSIRPVLVFNSTKFENYGLAHAHVLFPRGTLAEGWYRGSRRGADIYLLWGQFRNSVQMQTIMDARLSNVPCAFMDEGFIKSITPQVDRECSLRFRACTAFQFDPSTTYYDVSRPSALESMLNSERVLSPKEVERAAILINSIVENYISKYNHQPIYKPSYGAPGRKKILVLDQAYNDWSIIKGGVDEGTFESMLAAAIDENPDADIIVKTHPDMIGDRNRGGATKMGYFGDVKSTDKVYVVRELINPIAILRAVDKVYVCSSQMGFEALMCGKEVVTFGAPFYAGWGLTDDRLRNVHLNRRTKKRTVEEVFYFAYLEYSKYINPLKMRQCDLEEYINYIVALRKEYFDLNKVRFDEHMHAKVSAKDSETLHKVARFLPSAS